MRYAQITWVDRDHMIRAIKTIRKYFGAGGVCNAKLIYDMVLMQMNATGAGAFEDVKVVVPLPEDFDAALLAFRHVSYKVVTKEL